MDYETHPEKLQVLAIENGHSRDTNFGQNEDQILDMLMKQHGLFKREYNLFDNFHVMVNTSTVSMMRSQEGKEYLSEKFKIKNYKINKAKSSWEYLVRMKHPNWERTYLIFDDRGYPVENAETLHFHVMNFSDDLLIVKWLQYGVEIFKKDTTGKFVFEKPDIVNLEDFPEQVTLNMDEFSFKCLIENERIICDSFKCPALIQRVTGPLLTCLIGGKEYFFLNTQEKVYTHLPISTEMK